MATQRKTKEKDDQVDQVQEEPQGAKNDSGSADDFFKSDNSADIGSWISHMKSPREKIGGDQDIKFPEDEIQDAGHGESDEEVLNYFDYTEGHYKTAEFMLIQLDKFFAFGFSLISGMETDRYRLRKTKPKGDDYEAEIAAALLKKYQMELPLEWMLVSALAISYGPGFQKAFADRKAVQEAAKKSEKAQKMHRDAQVAIIFGRNGTGKSTFVQKLVKKIGSRALVVTFAGLPKIWRQYPTIDVADASAFEWKKGIRQAHWVTHEDDTAKYIFKHYRSGILIFDDCREYIPDRINQNPWLKRLLSSFRHKEIDLFFIAHAPSDIPPQIWMYNSAVFVGSTDALLPKRIKIGSAQKILDAQVRVNQKFLQAQAKNNKSHYGIFELVRPQL